jgi:hypothetical protein
MASRNFNAKQALEKEIKDIYAKITVGSLVAASAVLDLTNDITLTSVAAGTPRNTNTFTIIVNAAAANPTNTILVTFGGSNAAITCTVTPNDGTNNGAVAVDLTTAKLVELINTGAVVGKVITLTDAGSRRALQTASGGGAQNLVHSGEGDNVAATFSGGTAGSPTLTTGWGVASVVRNGTGDFTLTLADKYTALRNARAIHSSSTAQDIRVQVAAESVASAKTVQVLCTTGATVVDPANGTVLYVKLELKNTSVV